MMLQFRRRIESSPHCSHCWILVIALALAVRLAALGAESMSYDEAFTWWIARLDWPQFWQALTGDVHPPAWYLIERAALAIGGDSAIAIRLPSAMLGSAAVGLVYLIAREYVTPRAALVSGMIAALQPGLLYYSQDARMYPLLATALLCAFYAAHRRNWIAYAAAGAIACYTHNLAPFLVAPIGLAAIVADIQRGKPWRPVLASAAIVIAWSPWAIHMLDQARAMDSGFWLLSPVNAGDLLWPVAVLITGTRAPDPALVAGILATLVATLVALAESHHETTTRRGLLLFAGLFGGPALLLIASIVWRPVYLARAMQTTGHLWAVLIITGAFYTTNAHRRRLVAVLVSTTLAIGLVAHYNPAQGARTDVRELVDTIADNWQPGDLIVHSDPNTAISTAPYLASLPYCAEPGADDLTAGISKQTRQAFGLTACTGQQTRARRVWYIWQTPPTTTQAKQLTAAHYLTSHESTLVAEIGNNLAGVAIYLVDPGAVDNLQPVTMTTAAARALECSQAPESGILQAVYPLSDCAKSILSEIQIHD